MKLARAVLWFLGGRLGLLLLAGLPLGLGARQLAARLAEGDASLVPRLLPRLGDVASREPRALWLALAPLGWLLLAATVAPLVDRAATALLGGDTLAAAVSKALQRLSELLAVGVLALLVRLATAWALWRLWRGAEWRLPALAMPLTLGTLLVLALLWLSALRDGWLSDTTGTLRDRLLVGLEVLVSRPLSSLAVAFAGHLTGPLVVSLACAVVTRPEPVLGTGASLLLLSTALLLAALARALRLRAIGALTASAHARLTYTPLAYDE